MRRGSHYCISPWVECPQTSSRMTPRRWTSCPSITATNPRGAIQNVTGAAVEDATRSAPQSVRPQSVKRPAAPLNSQCASRGAAHPNVQWFAQPINVNMAIAQSARRSVVHQSATRCAQTIARVAALTHNAVGIANPPRIAPSPNAHWIAVALRSAIWIRTLMQGPMYQSFLTSASCPKAWQIWTLLRCSPELHLQQGPLLQPELIR